MLLSYHHTFTHTIIIRDLAPAKCQNSRSHIIHYSIWLYTQFKAKSTTTTNKKKTKAKKQNVQTHIISKHGTNFSSIRYCFWNDNCFFFYSMHQMLTVSYDCYRYSSVHEYDPQKKKCVVCFYPFAFPPVPMNATVPLQLTIYNIICLFVFFLHKYKSNCNCPILYVSRFIQCDSE